jgi:hypothetical protein
MRTGTGRASTLACRTRHVQNRCQITHITNPSRPNGTTTFTEKGTAWIGLGNVTRPVETVLVCSNSGLDFRAVEIIDVECVRERVGRQLSHVVLYGEGNCVDRTRECYATGRNDICSAADDFCASKGSQSRKTLRSSGMLQ